MMVDRSADWDNNLTLAGAGRVSTGKKAGGTAHLANCFASRSAEIMEDGLAMPWPAML
jgi:hypothetical protein